MNSTSIVDCVINPQSPWKLPRANNHVWRPNYARSAKYIKALFVRANADDAEAEYELSCYFEYGCKDLAGRIIVRRSNRNAVEWTLRSALHGETAARVALGNRLDSGCGMEKDPIQALRWYRMAARVGNSSAANNIAITFRQNGNFRRAVHWFRASIALGDDEARIQLGVHQYWGIGVRADHSAAIANFKTVTKAKFITEAGRDDAFFYLSAAYLEGKGVRQSKAIAREMLERAKRDNDHPAAAKLLTLIDMDHN
jgi:TPR repeat protein